MATKKPIRKPRRVAKKQVRKYADGGAVDSNDSLSRLAGIQSDVGRLESSADTFAHDQNWRKGHRLSSFQKDRIEGERKDLSSRATSLTGALQQYTPYGGSADPAKCYADGGLIQRFAGGGDVYRAAAEGAKNVHDSLANDEYARALGLSVHAGLNTLRGLGSDVVNATVAPTARGVAGFGQGLFGQSSARPLAPAPTPAPAPAPAPKKRGNPRPNGHAAAMRDTRSTPVPRAKQGAVQSNRQTDNANYQASMLAAGATPSRGGGYAMASNAPVTANSLAQQVRARAAMGGPGVNPGALSGSNLADARSAAQAHERRIQEEGGIDAVRQRVMAGPQAEADNRILQQWYALPQNQRGRAPARVREAMHRGETDQDTALNMARAQIIEHPGLSPEQRAQALQNLEAAVGKLRTDAQAADTADFTAKTDAEQRGRANDTADKTATAQAERYGVLNKIAEAEQARLERQSRPQFAQPVELPEATDALGNPNKAYEDARAAQIAQAQGMLSYKSIIGKPGFSTPQDIFAAAQQAKADGTLVDGKYDPDSLLAIFDVANIGYADGGVVQQSAPVYGGAPQVQRVNPAAIAYRDYATNAMAAGLPTVPFAQFAQLYSGAMQGPSQGYADGGAVSVAGREVIDPNPNAPTDSIPAVIDGTAPAALDSGEFVIPKDVVRYYGTKFFNGLIQKAEQPDGAASTPAQ